MHADPDALRRAADEMDALIARQVAHLADIERLEEERADALRCLGVAQRARDGFGSKLDRIADLVYPLGLRLHGDDVDAVVARVVRRLAGAEAERDALLAADAPMIAKLIDILGDACLPSEIAGRVRDLARRLEVAELDRAGLVATTDTLRRERDGARRALARVRAALGGAA